MPNSLLSLTSTSITQNINRKVHPILPSIRNQPTEKISRWSDFYGPIQHHGGEYTNLRRYNFSALQNDLGEPVYGYGNDTNPQPKTFQPANIVVLSDALCGSTCALFMELMKTQGGVQSITVGGRKQHCPMQTIGGSKGSNDVSMGSLAVSASHAYEHGNASQRTLFAPYVSLLKNANALLSRVQLGMNVNFQNNIRKGDESVTPLMFVYEASNCREYSASTGGQSSNR
jgi:hypothetical protein